MPPTIALVNICYPKEINIYAPPLGIMSIASFLSNNDVETRIYDISINIDFNDFTLKKITEYLLAIEEDIIGISVWDSVLPKVILSVQELKKQKDNKVIILGGPSVSNLSNDLIHTCTCVDYCIEGEGEYALLNLLHWIESPKTLTQLSSNIIGRKGTSVFRGKMKYAMMHANDIPIINYLLCGSEKSIIDSKFLHIEVAHLNASFVLSTVH